MGMQSVNEASDDQGSRLTIKDHALLHHAIEHTCCKRRRSSPGPLTPSPLPPPPDSCCVVMLSSPFSCADSTGNGDAGGSWVFETGMSPKRLRGRGCEALRNGEGEREDAGGRFTWARGGSRSSANWCSTFFSASASSIPEVRSGDDVVVVLWGRDEEEEGKGGEKRACVVFLQLAAAKYVVVVARGAPDAKGSDEVRYGDSTGDDRGSERKRGGCTCCDLRLFCNTLHGTVQGLGFRV